MKRMRLRDYIFNIGIALVIVVFIFALQNIKSEASAETVKNIKSVMVSPPSRQINIIDNNFINDFGKKFIEDTHEELSSIWLTGFEMPQYIRCTGYCDYGYTKSGEYTRNGIVAGKEEWLGKSCYIYSINPDGSCGELIGIYEFLDTGYGIDGSLIEGTSIDVWFPSEEAVWNWMWTYGDYVYIQIMDAVG